jgi:hypothetical protein
MAIPPLELENCWYNTNANQGNFNIISDRNDFNPIGSVLVD